MNLLLTNPLLLMLLLLLLSGCQLLEIKKPVPVNADPDRISTARHLEAKGQYGQAIQVLESAIAEDGKAESYTETLREIRLRQTLIEQELHRITSYNVCYTKLLRDCRVCLGPAFCLITGFPDLGCDFPILIKITEPD